MHPPVDGESTELGIPGLGPATRIGSGGFADVFRAQQTNLRREVAVKLLRAPANDAQARMRFERECHAVGAVSNHPNIVGVHEGGFTSDGRAYLVMEFFPGGSLRDRLDDSGSLSAPEVIDIGQKIGRALAVAHEAGVLHRDVKPANILISTYGEPGLADFGIARIEGGQQTATGHVTASIAHASPEALDGKPATAASDVYSLGSTLFELFAGTAPHVRPDDESVWALMNRVISAPIPDPASVGMPEPLASVVRRATMRDPAARYRSAAEMAQELATPSVTASAPISTPSQAVPPGQPPTVVSPSVDDVSATIAAPPVTIAEQNRNDTVAMPSVNTAHFERPSDTDRSAGDSVSVPIEPPKGRSRGPILILSILAAAAIAGGLGTWLLVRPGSDPLPPLSFEFPEGSSGPLDEGVAYDLAVGGADPDTRFRLVVDGEPVGEPATELAPFMPTAGRHRVAIEVSRGDERVESEAVEIYVIGELPEPGFRVNLLSVTAAPGNWPAAIANFDELVEAGHTDLELLPSDRFPAQTPGFWNLFVPGFGDDRQAGVDYCLSFDLSSNNDCFVSFFDPAQETDG